MIRIVVHRDEDGDTLTINGHANFAPHGKDIVCAAVSAIYQTAILGLAVVAKQYPSFVAFDGDVTLTDTAAGSAHHQP